MLLYLLDHGTVEMIVAHALMDLSLLQRRMEQLMLLYLSILLVEYLIIIVLKYGVVMVSGESIVDLGQVLKH